MLMIEVGCGNDRQYRVKSVSSRSITKTSAWAKNKFVAFAIFGQNEDGARVFVDLPCSSTSLSLCSAGMNDPA